MGHFRLNGIAFFLNASPELGFEALSGSGIAYFAELGHAGRCCTFCIGRIFLDDFRRDFLEATGHSIRGLTQKGFRVDLNRIFTIIEARF